MKSQTIQLKCIIALLLIMTSCQSNTQTDPNALSGEISISGAFALYPLAVKWAEEFQTLHPAVRIDISAGGAGKGMTDALSKVVDLGMVSREIYAPEREKGAVAIAVTIDAVVPTANQDNPLAAQIKAKGLSLDTAKKLWITESCTTWGEFLGTSDKTPIHLYTRSDACGAAETWAQWMGYKQEDLMGTAVFGDPGVAAAVQKDKLGIGFNNIGYAYDETTRRPHESLFILPLDVNQNGIVDPEENFCTTKDELVQAIVDGKYPSPPARKLYLVSNGVSQNPAAIAFIEYILTEGQAQCIPAGYIPLSQDDCNEGLKIIGAQ